ncbi:uncharacterized protein LOC119976535 [Scyliorhinus canicula]|uniref:uncharacterized protein LOC119976535 n=1 Tax=Scyliorhinus canicula TaxID=7830 RepID=UPI0018F53E23|nr:uncharacterized protein LOC119976535 [Scyliorhinus canicula]
MQTIRIWAFLNFMAILIQIDYGLRREIHVVQFPASINVTEGESVQLNCTFELSWKVGRVVWRRASGNTELSLWNPFYQGRMQMSGADLFAQSVAFIKIENLAKMDSDVYYCEVEVPTIGGGNGTGTQLTVTDRNVADCPPAGVSTNDRVYPLVLGLLGCSILVMILLLSRLHCQHQAISRLKGLQTVTPARRRSADMYGIIEVQETPSESRQGTVLQSYYSAPFREYSNIRSPGADKGSIFSNQGLTQSTFQ